MLFWGCGGSRSWLGDRKGQESGPESRFLEGEWSNFHAQVTVDLGRLQVSSFGRAFSYEVLWWGEA